MTSARNEVKNLADDFAIITALDHPRRFGSVLAISGLPFDCRRVEQRWISPVRANWGHLK
jgi:hypothetical protein